MQDWTFLDNKQWDFLRNPPRAGTSTVAGTPVDKTAAGVPVKPLAAIGLTAGYTPNYKDLILSDPAYLSWKNNANLDVSQAAAQRKAALQALTMRYGGLTPGFKDQYGDIDETTLGLAKGNQFSDLARLQRKYDEGVLGVKRSLAARGALQSGELGYGLGQADLARATSEYDLGQQFGNTAQTAINNFLDRETAARKAENDALAAAEANVYANPFNRPTEGMGARLDPEWQSKYGVPVYIGDDGRLYTLDASGNPVPYAPAGAAPPPPIDTGGTTTTTPPVIPGLIGPSGSDLDKPLRTVTDKSYFVPEPMGPPAPNGSFGGPYGRPVSLVTDKSYFVPQPRKVAAAKKATAPDLSKLLKGFRG